MHDKEVIYTAANESFDADILKIDGDTNIEKTLRVCAIISDLTQIPYKSLKNIAASYGVDGVFNCSSIPGTTKEQMDSLQNLKELIRLWDL